MRKFKIGASFFALFAVCVITKNILLLFNYMVALFLHEFAHIVVAEFKGYKLKEIKLGICGLSVKLDENVDDKDLFLINLAGPGVNLLLCLVCIAMFWIVPNSFKFLHMFCCANLILAGFNLIPVYPLDGGKIFKSLIKNDKKYKKINIFLKFFIGFIFLALFLFSFNNNLNVFYLLLGIFFLTLKDESVSNFSIFKYSKNRKVEKVVIIKISSNNTLFELIKMLNNRYYTLFYITEFEHHYLDEDKLIEIAYKNSLDSKIKDVLD